MKNILFFTLLLLTHLTFSSPSILKPGDIAIIEFNFKNPDEFSFVTLEDLNEGTIIYFTDCGWKKDKSFRKGEGLITYTVPVGGKKAFDIITYPDDPGFTTNGVSGFFGFSVDGDQIIAFQGTFDNPQFLFAINGTSNGWESDATDNNSTTLPDGLQDGITSLVLNEANARFNCFNLTSKDKSILLSSIANPANWTISSQRVITQLNCFSDILPIVIKSFSMIESNNKFHPFIEIESDEHFIVISEESTNGIDFTELETIWILPQIHKILFHTSTIKKYCRIKIISSNGVISYSEIKQVQNKKKNIIGIYVFNLNGEMIYSCNECNEDRFISDMTTKLNQPLILRKIYEDFNHEDIKIFEVQD